MRLIDTIAIHCTATREGRDYSVETIRRWHKRRGFIDIGYHYVIHLDGTVSFGRSIDKIGAHVKRKNTGKIGIVYVGGIGSEGEPRDTRTTEQRVALFELVRSLRMVFPGIKKVRGHRDYSPDRNYDGKITRDEWIKVCPCFDVQSEFPDDA